MMKFLLRIGNRDWEAVLNDSQTALRIWRSLPLEGLAQRWGDEIYFEVELELPLEDSARQEMEVGDLAYWPPGYAVAVFFGPTPASSGLQPVAASKVNLFGRLRGNLGPLKKVKEGEKVRLERVTGSSHP